MPEEPSDPFGGIPAAFRPPTHDGPDDVREPSVDARGVRTYVGIEYADIRGFRPLRVDVMVPPSPSGAPVPVVVYIHGGAFMMGSRRENWVAAPLWRALLDAGLAVASVEYRFSGEALFPACVNDVSAAVRWLRTHGAAVGVRADAVGVIGESAGGHLSAFLGLGSVDPRITGTDGVADASSRVDAAVAWYPPTDLGRMDEQATVPGADQHGGAGSPESRLIGAAVAEHPDRAAFASPITHVTDAAAPLLLIHGERDRAVPVGQSIALAAALEAVGADVTLEVVPGADHVFAGVDRAPIIARSVAFLAAHLVP